MPAKIEGQTKKMMSIPKETLDALKVEAALAYVNTATLIRSILMEWVKERKARRAAEAEMTVMGKEG